MLSSEKPLHGGIGRGHPEDQGGLHECRLDGYGQLRGLDWPTLGWSGDEHDVLMLGCCGGLDRRTTAVVDMPARSMVLRVLDATMAVHVRCPDHDRATPDEEGQQTGKESTGATDHGGEARG